MTRKYWLGLVPSLFVAAGLIVLAWWRSEVAIPDGW